MQWQAPRQVLNQTKALLPLRQARAFHPTPCIKAETQPPVAAPVQQSTHEVTSTTSSTLPRDEASGPSDGPLSARDIDHPSQPELVRHNPKIQLKESPDEATHAAWRQKPSSSDSMYGPRPKKKTKAPASTETAAFFEPPPPPKEKPLWGKQKERLKEKFPEGWKPRKRLSPDALVGIRALNAQFPDIYTNAALASRFEVSPEAIRRILKSRWQPSADAEKERQERWLRRGASVWERKAQLGHKPPKKWREMGITRDAEYHERRDKFVQKNRDWEAEENRKYKTYLENKAAGKGGSR